MRTRSSPPPSAIGETGSRDAARPLVDWHAEATGNLTRGERAADRLRNGMGSWTFVGLFLAAMAVWALVNTVGPHWDPYPFILLNLFLSMLAGLQGAILLIAAKRQDAIAAALSQHDFDTNLAAKREIEELMEINHRQIELLQQIRDFATKPSAVHPSGVQSEGDEGDGARERRRTVGLP